MPLYKTGTDQGKYSPYPIATIICEKIKMIKIAPSDNKYPLPNEAKNPNGALSKIVIPLTIMIDVPLL